METENTAVQTEQEQIAPVQQEETAAEPEQNAKIEQAAEPAKAEPPEAAEPVPESTIAKIIKSLGVPAGMSDEDGLRSLADELVCLRGAFEAIAQGANAETAKELASIAVGKVTDKKDISAVISELKKQPAYSGFFKTVPTGTGNAVVGKPARAQNGSIGTRLAQSAKKPVESPYFKN